MSILVKNLSRRDFLTGTSKAGGALVITSALGSGIARAKVDTSKFLTDGKIEFGTVLPLSGPFTVVSQPWIHAIQYAIEEVNAAGGVKVGGKSYEVANTVGDSKYTAAGGLGAFRKMVSRNVRYTGGYVSVEAPQAVQGINQRYDTMMVEGITGKDLALSDNNLRFYEFALAQATAPYMADFAFNALKTRRVASIELSNTWGHDFHQSFKNTFEELGGTMVNRSYLQPTQTDFSAVISQMAADKADLLYLIMGDGPATSVAVQARSGGLGDIPIIGQGAWGPEMLSSSKGAAALGGTYYQGVYPYVHWSQHNTKLNKKLLADTNLNLNNWFWHGYDSTKIVLWAMEEANSLNPKDVIKAIPETVTKHKKDIMVQAEGAISTADKGIFLKIPLWLAKFNAKADFAYESALNPVAEKKYLSTPGWMPHNWEGYKADPKDKSINWYPTLNEIDKMRKDAGENA